MLEFSEKGNPTILLMRWYKKKNVPSVTRHLTAIRFQLVGVFWLTLFASFISICGCRTGYFKDSDFSELTKMGMRRMAQIRSKSRKTAMYTRGKQLASAHFLEGPHPLEDYIQFALVQNPEILAARKQIESRIASIRVARGLPDPNLTAVSQPAPVQTAAGEFQFILNANQKFPWFGKLNTRGLVADAEASIARAELAAVELDTISNVKKAYFELSYVQRAIIVTETEQKLLEQLQSVADTRYQTGETSFQDVLRADLEISSIENSLIDLRQRKIAQQARLARLLHMPPDTQPEALPELPAEQLPTDIESLRQQALTARPELKAAMNRVTRDRRATELACLDYKPDVTFGFAWIDVADAGLAPSSNGQDALLLTAGVNLPIYRKRLAASVRSAEASTIASARKYDALKDATIQEVTDLFTQAQSHLDMLTLFLEDILPKAEQTLEVSSQAYAVGDVDFLQLLDNWRQLLRYELGRERLEADLRQALADLEQVVGGWRNWDGFWHQEVIPVSGSEDISLLEEELTVERLPPPPALEKNFKKIK